MSREEICFKLIEFYYKNIYKSYNISLKGLFENYNKMLKMLKVESDE